MYVCSGNAFCAARARTSGRRARALADVRARRDFCAHCWATPHSDTNLLFKCVNEIYLWFDL